MGKRRLRRLNQILGPLLFLMIYLMPIHGLSFEGKAVLACTVWVAYWWITEAAELAVTSLLPVIIFPLSGALSIKDATAPYAHPFIFLFMGGFLIGLAIERWNLHQRIAFSIIRAIGESERRILLGFMIATAFLSMWISNTATAVMMLPIGVSVSEFFRKDREFGKNLMLGIAYAASIGGMGTLIGTPPNIILAGVLKESMGMDISFFSWMKLAMPFVIVLLLIAWWYLSRKMNASKQQIPIPSIDEQGKVSVPEKRVFIVFCIVAFLWMSRTWIWNKWIPQLDDTMIAMIGALSLFIIPSGKIGENLMNWETARKLPWSVLLIFGAGLSIAGGFSHTDLTAWLAGNLQHVNVLPFIIILIVIAAINFLTEITSNTATASIVLPLLFSMSHGLQVPPLQLLIGACLATSCAFMLPVATPPNAIVFSSGQLTIKDMVRAGIVMNIISIILVFTLVQTLVAVIF